jgi:hypothetical protein
MFSQSIPNTAGAARKITLLSILQISLPLTVLVYCAGFHYSYVNWVSPVWAYEGLTYASPPPVLLVLAYALAALLAVVSPPKLLKPSHAAYWILLFIVYVPGIFVPLFLRLVGEPGLLALQLGLTGGMLIIAFSSRLPSLNFPRYPLDSGLFWGIFLAIYLIGNAMMIVVYRNYIHFASLETMYSVRHESGKVLVQNPITGYISQLLANVLNPLLMVYGFAKRKKKLALLGFAGQLLLYGIFANKLTLLSPIVIAGLYYTVKNDRGGWIPKMSLFLAGVFFSLTTLVIGVGSGILFNLATVAIVRNFAIPGMLVGQYQYFFENEPHTYLGTVTGISLIVPDAYTLPVGVEVSAFYGAKDDSERGRANGNASLFATDGIAAFGLWGIPIAGAMCAIVLWVLDGCAKNYAIEFSVAANTMVIYSFANVSLFTTLLGNGLIVWMLLFVFMPRSFSDPALVRRV